MEAPREIYIEQDLDDGCVYEHWYDTNKVPIESGAQLIKYHHDDKYQKAVEALKENYRVCALNDMETSAALTYQTLKELGEMDQMDDYISDAYELSVLRAENERLKKQVEILTEGLKFYENENNIDSECSCGQSNLLIKELDDYGLGLELGTTAKQAMEEAKDVK